VAAQFVSRADGFDRCAREHVQVGVYVVGAPGKNSFAAIRFLTGFLNGVTNAAGPTLAIYLYRLKLHKRTFVKSLGTIFVTTNKAS
jgi:hypothetical protein